MYCAVEPDSLGPELCHRRSAAKKTSQVRIYGTIPTPIYKLTQYWHRKWMNQIKAFIHLWIILTQRCDVFFVCSIVTLLGWPLPQGCLQLDCGLWVWNPEPVTGSEPVTLETNTNGLTIALGEDALISWPLTWCRDTASTKRNVGTVDWVIRYLLCSSHISRLHDSWVADTIGWTRIQPRHLLTV